ncbi:hypothetical protein O6H91_Y199500 [Diphasiastrum complanatum]|nr:hypothetical protein O6H91_Y199500 [Diphasiastrum complanatum]
MANLDSRRAEVLSRAARVIQHKVRTYLARREFAEMRRAAIKVQAHWRGRLARKVYESIRQAAAAIRIQKYVRKWQCQKSFAQKKNAAITLQAGIRGMSARTEYRFRRQTRAATVVQARWRGFKARTYYSKLQKAAITFQCVWRGKVARKELKKLKNAAKETGALQEAKTKLEKRCEELTWRLQLEKRMRVDIEEAKAQELAKLQTALHNLQAQVDAANVSLKSERTSHKVALDEVVPAEKVLPAKVADNSRIESLLAENGNLKSLVETLERKVAETEKNLVDSRQEAEKNEQKAAEAVSKLEQFQDTLQRLEDKISNLESENQVLRQQTLVISPAKGLAIRLKSNSFQESTPTTQTATEQKRQKLLIDRQQESQDVLLRCIVQDVGFSHDKPVAACIIYKALLHWRSFEAERTNVFDRIIQTIGTAIESQDNNNALAYWLSNTSTLLFMLQRTLKVTGVSGSDPQRRRSSSVTLFGRMTQGFRSSPSEGVPSLSNGGSTGKVEILRQVEAKYPALLFKQQLTAYVEKIYGIIRDNLKKEISPMLGLCIQAPRTSKVHLGRSAMRALNPSTTAQQTLSSHWHSIIKSLSALLSTLKSNYVPPFLVQKIFTQIFSFINVQLFNSLLLRRECCSFSNGEYVKAGLAELEHWVYGASEEYAGSSWDELKYIRQAVGFLVIHQKPKKSLDEITHDLCPVLSIQQLYRISTMYWDDKYGTHSVSPEVIASMRVLMTEDSNNAVSNSFLLDDDSSIPFSVDDISRSMLEIDLATLELPPLLRDNPSFYFIHPQTE